MSMRILSLLLFCAVAVAQDGLGTRQDPNGPRIAREAMWPAPTAEDWKKPCCLTWQRTWEDAVKVSKETGHPILVCINMDGEIASEHYAGVRYRDPAIAALYEPYVTVIASVYRHNPRDYDDEGRRIPCPRFGGVTCGEHIEIEPTIFEKFCDGQRVAPRHICVELDGKESYDVFYMNDTASVFDAIRDGIAKRPPLPPIIRGDRPVLERVGSSDVRDRTAVEAAYRDGDASSRKALLDAALKAGGDHQLELLRLALFGLDVDQSRAAQEALTKVASPEATRLVADALRVPMDEATREALLATLKRLGGGSPLARYLSVVHGGLAERSEVVNTSGAATPGVGGTYPAPAGWYRGPGLASHIESKAAAAEARPEEPGLQLDLAEASLALAMQAPTTYSDPRSAGMLARMLHDDARRCALEAERLGSKDWRVHAVLALAAYYGGDAEGGYARAEPAVKALPQDDRGWMSMAVLTVFAESRWKAIKAAVREQKQWPSSWITDLHAAYSMLLRHPLGTDGQVSWHYDLLDWLGADWRADRVLRAGLDRFTDSAALHERLRDRLLKVQGGDGLEAGYAEMLKGKDEGARGPLLPFASAASIAAAEHFRKQGDLDKALASYARAIELKGLDAAALALAHAGRARLLLSRELDDDALAAILASFEASPGTAGERDGMGITPGETAQMLLAKLRASRKEEGAARLEEALRRIDPELLRPDRE